MKEYRQHYISPACCLVLFLAIAWFPIVLNAQAIDSLEQQISLLSTKDKIKRYDDLAWDYKAIDRDKSVYFGKKGLDLAIETGDKKMEVTLYHTIGTSYTHAFKYDSARIYLDKALFHLFKMKQKDHRKEAVLYFAFGELYHFQSNFPLAIANFHKAVTIFEQVKDYNTLASTLAKLGQTYHLMRNNDQALHYFKKSEEMALKTNNQVALASVSVSLADLYLYIGEEMEESVRYASQAASIFRETGDPIAENMALLTLAKVYYHYKDYTKALPIAKNVVQEAENLGYQLLTTQSLLILGNIYYRIGNYKQTLDLAQQVIQIDTTNTNSMINVYANMTLGYAQLGRLDLMEDYFARYEEKLTSFSNETFQNSLSEMEVKYETEKKNLTIVALEKQRNLYLMLGGAGAVILLIALAFAIIRNRLAVSKRKLAEQATLRSENEKQLVAVQATLDGETAERTRLAKDLHDGLGSMLSLVKFNMPQVKGDALLESMDVSRFQKALGMLDDSIHELRRVAHHMMPESLLRYGLKVSLADFCAAIPNADFHYFGNESRLEEKIELMVYRCIHELVNNALKHAQAAHIHVQLVQEQDRVSFTVQDDGIGFDPARVAEGMGLKNVRQRVAAFQGQITIYPSKQGTEIHVELELIKNSCDD